MYLGAHVCKAITVKGKSAMILRGNMGASKGVIWEELERGNGKEMCYIYIFKIILND